MNGPNEQHWKAITSIAGCILNGIPILDDEGDEIGESGHWVEATCGEHFAAMIGAGGYDALMVFGSMTQEDAVFTEWGRKDCQTPVAACGGYVTRDQRARGCEGQTHAIFIPEKGPR